nr:hypothetical protein [Deinococcus roseus]
MDASIVQHNNQLSRNLFQQVSKKLSNLFTLAGTLHRVLIELSTAGQATDHREFFPVGASRNQRRFPTGGPGFAGGGFHAETSFIQKDQGCSRLDFLFDFWNGLCDPLLNLTLIAFDSPFFGFLVGEAQPPQHPAHMVRMVPHPKTQANPVSDPGTRPGSI